MKKIILLMVFSAIIMGCKKQTAGEDIYRRSFSSMFFITGDINLLKMDLIDDPMAIRFQVDFGLDASNDRIDGYGYEDTGEKKERYDEFCEKYGDMTFDRDVFTVAFPIFQAYSFVSVDIVSNADFDSEHPAGTSLNDLMIFDSFSSKPYIDNGYEEYDWGDDDKFPYYTGKPMRPYYPVYKKASELLVDDMKLLYGASGYAGLERPYGYLHFEKAPELSKTHLITVTFTDELGETFSDSIEMTFE